MTVLHPQLDENGLPVEVSRPAASGPVSDWTNPSRAATYSITDPVELPRSLNGVAFTRESLGASDWARLMVRYADFEEPAFPKTEKRRTSGMVVLESDGRIWLAHPTNQFCGVEATFPKGRLEPGLSLVVNAVKECWEESGLVAEPLQWLCDVERTKTMTRYYLARRTGGSPVGMGWESQAVSLVPVGELEDFLNRPNDRKVLPSLKEALGAFDREA